MDDTDEGDVRHQAANLRPALILMTAAYWTVLAFGAVLLGTAMLLALDLMVGRLTDRGADLGWTIEVFRVGLVGLVGGVLVGLAWSTRGVSPKVAALRFSIAAGVAILLVPFVNESVPIAGTASPLVALIALGSAAAHAVEHRKPAAPHAVSTPGATSPRLPVAGSRRDR